MTDRHAVEATRPKDLIFTLFGEYLLEHTDAVWVGSLIALLEPLGLTEGSVRTSLSRMAKKGWLHTERVGKHAVYGLTEMGRSLLEEGQDRILHPTWDRGWDGRWLLLTYSIPEDARKARDRLRDRLAWLGFGSIGNGIWLTPHDVQEEIQALSRRMGLQDHLMTFRLEPMDDARTAELVSRCWDLADLDGSYEAFTRRWKAEFESGPRKDEGSDASRRAFRLRFELIHEFRRFPLEDPFLPRRLLPDPWSGDEASRVFRGVRDALLGPADAYVREVLASSVIADADR